MRRHIPGRRASRRCEPRPTPGAPSGGAPIPAPVQFPVVKDAVATVLDPSSIRWISFSHFEADECGALREWQTIAPDSVAACSLVSKEVSVDDVVALRPSRAMADGECLETGRFSFQFLRTPNVPHCWDASLLFEQTGRTLFCSDLFHQNGDVEPSTSSDVVGRFRQMLLDYEAGPFGGYLQYSDTTGKVLAQLADLAPETLAVMHGSSFVGDGRQALMDLSVAMRETLDGA